jgi:DNA-binding XRE family transcriptional regulator
MGERLKQPKGGLKSGGNEYWKGGDFNMAFIYVGNNLRLAREQAKLNQRQLAELSHTPQSVISDVELGKRKPWPSLAQRLSKALKVSIKDLFPEGVTNGR